MTVSTAVKILRPSGKTETHVLSLGVGSFAERRKNKI
jgi:hypothetical protein